MHNVEWPRNIEFISLDLASRRYDSLLLQHSDYRSGFNCVLAASSPSRPQVLTSTV